MYVVPGAPRNLSIETGYETGRDNKAEGNGRLVGWMGKWKPGRGAKAVMSSAALVGYGLSTSVCMADSLC